MTNLSFERVHIYERHGGSEVLVRTNLYKMFERRADPKDKTSPLQAYYAQGGHWYDRGGNIIPTEEIPEWVWDECRAMKDIDRGMYRILLPAEIAAGASIPTFEEATEYPPGSVIMKALMSLDPRDDGDWTAQGLPNLEALSKLAGARVSRQRLSAVAPRFVRPA